MSVVVSLFVCIKEISVYVLIIFITSYASYIHYLGLCSSFIITNEYKLYMNVLELALYYMKTTNVNCIFIS